MHRERGFNRFFVLYALFVLGMVVTSLAGTIETLFAGWELVGLSSALLVAFFQERPAPARNGLWVWVVYRVSDAALLLAAVVMHHLRGEGDFDKLLGSGSWPDEISAADHRPGVGRRIPAGRRPLRENRHWCPFSGWLAASNGRTDAFQRRFLWGACRYTWERSCSCGSAPCLTSPGSLCGDRRSGFDERRCSPTWPAASRLTSSPPSSFASLSQVGIIVAEIGLGFRYVALVHLLGHACLRTLQFVRAPSLLQDYRTIENAIGQHLTHSPVPWNRVSGGRDTSWLYRLALGAWLSRRALLQYAVAPFVRAFRWCDALERRWTDFLAGETSRESDQVKPQFGTIEEFS